MKKTLFNILGAAAFIGVTLTSFQGCKLGDPMEGVVITIKADAVTAPSELLVRDSKTGSPLAGLTSAVPVTISGPGAAYVYSSGATKTISLFQGAVSFSLRKGTPVSESNPIKFTVFINVPGYLPLEYPITLTSLDPIQQEAYLVNFDAPPAGAASNTKTVGTGSDGKTTDTSSIVIPATADKPEALKIAIDAGTQMLDAAGQPVSGAVEAKVMQFTAGTEESLKSFPGGLEFNELKDANGSALPAGGFEPAGWIDMNMTAGGKFVKSFDKPLNVTMEINPDQINPLTDAKYKVGDIIDIYSKTAGENNWVKEGTATIALNSNNKLVAQMPVKHLSTWAMGIILPKCGEPLTVSVNFPIGYYVNTLYIYKTFVIRGRTVYDYEEGVLFLEEYDGSGRISKKSTFTPIDGVDYLLSFNNDRALLYTGPLCGKLIDLGTQAPVDKLTNNVFIKCSNGNGVLLPDNYKVYYISEDDYNNTINTNTGRKIDPRDPAINGKDWKETVVANRTVNGKTINTITLPKADMVIGQKYRFSVYYNDGTSESREDYVTPAPIVQEVLDAGGQDVVIILAKCPI